ncbi:trace amine-associated receptor 7a-like [Protopterus annectens]|uniref:trace amine-associated receptor 7a-like n=1 Tax=Protopterus annectens TaxID=7888 RepID=UPI001CFA38E4|nr:trace amine-associated receptor 7a-like [Protopterus annectens]
MSASLPETAERVEYCYDNLNGSCIKMQRSSSVKMSLYILFGFGAVLTISGNLLVIISISYFKQLHTPTNILVLSLAVADFLLGLTVLPFSIIRSVETCWFFGEYFCRFHSCLDGLFGIASIFHLCFISIDRYFAITIPLKYPLKFTMSFIICLILSGWIVAFVYIFSVLYLKANEEGLDEFVTAISCYGSCQFIFNTKWGLINSLIFFVPCFLMMSLYTRIFIVARKHARKIEISENRVNISNSSSNKTMKREQKAAKTLGIAMGTFALCWLPFFIDTMIDSFLNFITPSFAFDIIVWIAYFNSSLNPLIYAFFYPWFRNATKLIMTCQILTVDCTNMNIFDK